MTEHSAARLWGMRIMFLLLGFTILFFQLLPLDMTPSAWVGPDLLLCFALAWSMRRPEFVPIGVLAGVFLLADLLLQRPPGLWAVCALLACDRLQTRARMPGEISFFGEWLTAVAAATAIACAYRLGLSLTFSPLPPLGLSLLQLIMTVLFYPVAVALTQWAFGVKRPAPGDLNSFGSSL